MTLHFDLSAPAPDYTGAQIWAELPRVSEDDPAVIDIDDMTGPGDVSLATGERLLLIPPDGFHRPALFVAGPYSVRVYMLDSACQADNVAYGVWRYRGTGVPV